MAEHSIFGASAPSIGTLATTSDGQSVTVSNAFYTSATGWTIKRVRLYCQTGSALIGTTVTFKVWTPAVDGSGLGGAGASSVVSGTLVAGWNEATLPSPVAVPNISTTNKFSVSYTTTGPYQYVGYVNSSGIKAADGSNLWLSEHDSGAGFTTRYCGYFRYADGSNGNTNTYWGLDVVVDDGISSGITGTLNATLPKLTASLSGASLTTGVVNGQLPKLTASIPGNVTSATTGTLNATLPKLTANIAGSSLTTGTVNGQLPKLTASIPGTVALTGSINATLPKLTASINDVARLTIAQENALTAGVAAPSFWYDYGTDQILGFARSSYYTPGQTAQFSVDYASSYTCQVWRLGWYGSDGARKVAEFAGTTATQPAATAIPNSNGAVTCAAWSQNVSWAIPADATPGWYWLFMRNAGSTQFGGILFCVSDTDAKKPILVVASEATWGAAYNGYGGNNVYGASNGIGAIASRALCSTYDKPVISRDNVPQTHFFNGELAQLRFMERFGFEVGYATCEQINNDPTVMDGRSLIVFSGHNEYISQRIRDKTVERIAAGVNVANFSANDFFWRTAYAGTTFPTGNTGTSTGRVMWCKKDTMAGPSAIRTGGAGTPFTTAADWTGTWQDTRWTGRKPPSELFGDRFIANGIRNDETKVPFALKTSPIWRNAAGVQALTTGQTYSFGVGTAGMEWDMPDGNLPSVSLSASTVDLAGNSADVDGEDYNENGVYTHAFQMVRNGPAHIFNANTTQWGWALDDLHMRGGSIATATARQATLNVLYDLGAVAVSSLITAASLTAPTPVADIDTAYGLPVTVTGAIAATLPRLTASIAGASLTTASLTASLPKLTASLAGASLTVGAIAAALPKLTADITGVSYAPTTGSLDAQLPKLTVSITGESFTPITGSIAAALPKLLASINGDNLVPITGTLNASMPRLTGSLPGVVVVAGLIDATLPRLRASFGAGTPIQVITGQFKQPRITARFVGQEVVLVLGYPDLPVRHVPREGSAPIGDLLEVQVNGQASTAVQLGIGTSRPVTQFTAWPGPAKPTTPGSYLVLVTDNAGQPEAIGWLVVY